MVPFYDEHSILLCRVLTDRGTEFCGTQSHEYELYLAVEDIDHSRTKTKSPQTTDVIDKRFFRRSLLSCCGAQVTAWRRAGHEVRALPRSPYRHSPLRRPCALLAPLGYSRQQNAHKRPRPVRPNAVPGRDGS